MLSKVFTFIRFLPTAIKLGVPISALVAGLLFSAWVWHKKEIEIALIEQRQILVEQHNLELIKVNNQKQAIEQSLREEILVNERTKNEEIRRINARHNSIVAGLRDRPIERQTPTNDSRDSSEATATAGATGLQLSALDAEVVVRFSRDTAELQSELIACMRDFEDVRLLLNQSRKQ